MWSPICYQCWLGKYWLSLTPKWTSCWLSSCDDGADWLIFANYARGCPTNNNLDQTIWNGRLQQIRGFDIWRRPTYENKVFDHFDEERNFLCNFLTVFEWMKLRLKLEETRMAQVLGWTAAPSILVFLQSFRLMISINTFLFTKLFLAGKLTTMRRCPWHGVANNVKRLRSTHFAHLIHFKCHPMELDLLYAQTETKISN